MPPILSKSSVLKTKPRKNNASIMQIPATLRRKIYSELPMIDIQHSYCNVPVINSPAKFSEELTGYFPNDLEQSFHLGQLAACAAPQPLGELKNRQSSDRHGNKRSLTDCISSSVSVCEKITLDCKHEYPALFNEQNAHDFLKDGKVHQTYLSRKRTNKSGQQQLTAKRFLSCGVADDIACCQMIEFSSTKEKSSHCEETAILPQLHTTVVDNSAFSSTLASELVCRSISVVNVLSKRERHVTFADEVDKREILGDEEFHTSEQSDFVKYVSSDPNFCEADEQLLLTSDLHNVDQHPEDSDFSDSPFYLSQKYSIHGAAFDDWKLTEQEDLQEGKLYADHSGH